MRDIIGMDVPLSADHFGHIGLNSCIRLGKALEKYNMAWLEDMIPWQYTDLLKEIKGAIKIVKTAKSVANDQVNPIDLLRDAADIASIVDPTPGLLSLVAAYCYPVYGVSYE